MSTKIFANDRHRIFRDCATGSLESAVNSLIGLKDPVKISIYDKKTRHWGYGIAKVERDAETKAWRDLNSKNNS